ncbi:MAG: NADH-quinone oxidoreductase subunit N, partial [Bacteroidota bacterium]|nr:NADH-quinone oxidoreductase subunit N [Bacteroidota bacterium]
MQKSILSLTTTLEQIQNGLGALLPEILLAAFCLLVVFTDLFKADFAKSILPFLALLGLSLILGVQFTEGLSSSRYARPEPFLLGLLVKDGLSMYAGILFSLSAIITIGLVWHYYPFKTHYFGKGEFYAYLLVLVLGLNLMVKSANLLMLFISIELVSIASYLL